MFHKSLSQVPAGLTPIRTRSSDHEVDMFNVHSMRAPPSPVLVRDAITGRKTRLLGPLQCSTAGCAAAAPAVLERLHDARAALQVERSSSTTAAAAPYGPESFWGAFHHMMLDVGFVSRGPEKAAFWMAIWLAFFNQVWRCGQHALRAYAHCLAHLYPWRPRTVLLARRAPQQPSSTMRPACWSTAAWRTTATPSCTPLAWASARWLPMT